MSDEPKLVLLRNYADIMDTVFFRKQDIVPDTELVYHGRLDPMSRWRVERIYHYNRQMRRKRVDTVQTLNDEIWLVRIGGDSTTARRTRLGNHFEPTFLYISYSALWRIV